jgi:hypothetical protein
MVFAMKQKKTDISLEEKARRANGLSRSCSKCNHFPCSEVFSRLCSKAFVEGFKKGYQKHRKELSK